MLVAMVVAEGCAGVAGGDSWRLWSDEVFNFSSSSSLVHCDLKKLLVCSSVYATSDVRPFSKSVVAVVSVGI